MAVTEHIKSTRLDFGRGEARDGHAGWGAAVGAVWAGIAGKTVAAVRTIQVARMISVLVSLNDEQLAEIGITRQDIPAYAERLILGDLAGPRDGRPETKG